MIEVDYRDRDVLEVGCGSGRFTTEHLLHARSILGLDSDAKALDELRAEWPTLSQAAGDWRVGSVLTYPLPAEAFDLVVISHML